MSKGTGTILAAGLVAVLILLSIKEEQDSRLPEIPRTSSDSNKIKIGHKYVARFIFAPGMSPQQIVEAFASGTPMTSDKDGIVQAGQPFKITLGPVRTPPDGVVSTDPPGESWTVGIVANTTSTLMAFISPFSGTATLVEAEEV